MRQEVEQERECGPTQLGSCRLQAPSGPPSAFPPIWPHSICRCAATVAHPPVQRSSELERLVAVVGHLQTHHVKQRSWESPRSTQKPSAAGGGNSQVGRATAVRLFASAKAWGESVCDILCHGTSGQQALTLPLTLPTPLPLERLYGSLPASCCPRPTPAPSPAPLLHPSQ